MPFITEGGRARYMRERLEKISNFLVSIAAGFAAFAFTLVAVLRLTDVNEKVAAAVIMGLFALLIVWVASEQPNSRQDRKSTSLNSSQQGAHRMMSYARNTKKQHKE